MINVESNYSRVSGEATNNGNYYSAALNLSTYCPLSEASSNNLSFHQKDWQQHIPIGTVLDAEPI